MSPASNSNTSPGTISFESTSFFIPSLITFALGADSSFNESRDFSAFTYWKVPSMAFKIITANITIVLSTFPEIIEITAATIKIITSKSANCPRKILNTLFLPFSSSAFSPYFCSISFALFSDSPSGPPYLSNSSCFVC